METSILIEGFGKSPGSQNPQKKSWKKNLYHLKKALFHRKLVFPSDSKISEKFSSFLQSFLNRWELNEVDSVDLSFPPTRKLQ